MTVKANGLKEGKYYYGQLLKISDVWQSKKGKSMVNLEMLIDTGQTTILKSMVALADQVPKNIRDHTGAYVMVNAGFETSGQGYPYSEKQSKGFAFDIVPVEG